MTLGHMAGEQLFKARSMDEWSVDAFDGFDEGNIPVKKKWLIRFAEMAFTWRFILSVFTLTFSYHWFRAVHPEHDGNRVHYAAARGDMVALRLAKDDDEGTLAHANGYGNTPLHIACELGQLEAVEFLLTTANIKFSMTARNQAYNGTPLTSVKMYKFRYGNLRAEQFRKNYGPALGWVLSVLCGTHACEANAAAITKLLKDWGKENNIKVEM